MKTMSRRTVLKLAVSTAFLSGKLRASAQKGVKMKQTYDVLIIGGGAAGLTAALSLGRMRRAVVVFDDGRPRNAPAAHMNNFPGRDGTPPEEWREEIRENLKKYKTVKFEKLSVSSITHHEGGFLATTTTGETYESKKVILAHGVSEQLPTIPGLIDVWGKSVFFCPYCHGFEVQYQPIGVIANGDKAMHVLTMMSALSKNVVLFTDGPSSLNDEQEKILKKNGVVIHTSSVAKLHHRGPQLDAVELKSGEIIKRSALFLIPQLPFKQKSALGFELGCELTDLGLYKVNEKNETSVKGVFAGGDDMTMMHSVLIAASQGMLAAAGANFDLLDQQFRNHP
jgi:thioredoxin reductase